MIPFRRYFNSEVLSDRTPWLEMGMDWAPSNEGKNSWMLKLSDGAVNLISIAPATITDEDKEVGDKTKSRNVQNQARIAQWILQDGLKQASENRAKFVKEFVNPILPDVTELTVFSLDAHRKNKQLARLWRMGLNGSNSGMNEWFENYEPKWLKNGPLAIDLEAANDAIRGVADEGVTRSDAETFFFGGPDGFMEHLEKASWAEKQSYNEPDDRQGVDLRNPTYVVDQKSGSDWIRFKGLEAPRNLRYYEQAIQKALWDTDEDLRSTADGRALTAFHDSLSDEKTKQMPYSTTYGYDHRPVSAWLPPEGEDPFDSETFEHILALAKAGMADHGYSDEDVEDILSKITSDERPGRIKARLVNPLTGNKRQALATYINRGYELEHGHKMTSLTLHTPQDIDYSKFAYTQRNVPEGEPTDLGKITDSLYAQNWEWILSKKEQDDPHFSPSGHPMPSPDRTMATLKQGGQRIRVGKNDDGLWQIYTPGKLQKCGPNGCGIITRMDLRVNHQMPRMIPAPAEKTKQTMEDMVLNPWKYGEVDIDDKHTTFSNLNELPSVIMAARKAPHHSGVDYKKYKADYGEIDAANGAIAWIELNIDDKRFMYGDLWGGKFIGPSLEEAGYTPEQAAQIISMAKQHLQGGPEIEDERALGVLLRNGKMWRETEMATFARNHLRKSRDEKSWHYKQNAVDKETGKELDNSGLSVDDRTDAIVQGDMKEPQRAAKVDALTQDISGVDQHADPQAMIGQAKDAIHGASQNRVYFMRRKEFNHPQLGTKYEARYRSLSKDLSKSKDNFTVATQNMVVLATNTRDKLEKYAMIDAAHDYMMDILDTSDVNKDVVELARHMPLIINDIKEIEASINQDNPLIDGKTLLKKADALTTSQGVPAVEVPVKKAQDNIPNISTDPEGFSQEVQWALQSGDQGWLSLLRGKANSNPELMAIWKQLAGQQQQQQQTAHHNPLKAGMMTYSEWRSIKETDAIYDGTPAKDGGGFNWWGAVGKPGGVSIEGEADDSKENPTGKKKRKKKNVKSKK